MSLSKNHDEIVQTAFTQQAEAYATNPNISDRARIAKLIEAVQPCPSDRVLEIATGPGYIALAFAAFVHEVVGIDLTEAPLAIAEKLRQEHGLTNVRFEPANARQLPFPKASFDIVVCRLAFHHFEEPLQILQEMVKVCKPGGTIAVQDMASSEHWQRAEYHNQVERLRDPSHTMALSISQMLVGFAGADLEVEQVSTEYQPQVVEQWLQNGHTPPREAELVRQLLERDCTGDLSGMETFRDDQGNLCFERRMALVIGRKLRV